MRDASKKMRLIATVLSVSGVFGILGALAAPGASAQGISHEKLVDQGWTCFVPPPVPDWVVCYSPGLGRPFPGNPDPRPSYPFLTFDSTSGEFIHTGLLIRQDLYHGQPCRDGEPYRFVAPLGYYECVRD
jgi:hypothetical protein